MMTHYNDHVDYQITNKLTNVNFPPYVVEFKDHGLKAGIEMVKGVKGPTRKMNKFEYSVAELTPCNHVSKNINTNRKRGASGISNIFNGGVQISETRAKKGRGSTGVKFRYHKYDKLTTISKEQHDEFF